jgi:hypothetical protein
MKHYQLAPGESTDHPGVTVRIRWRGWLHYFVIVTGKHKDERAMICTQCDHDWNEDELLEGGGCPICDSPPGQPNAATLELCFWEALKRCASDDDVPLNLTLRDAADTGSGIELPNPIPSQLWRYMADAHAELHAVAFAENTR